MDTSQAHIEEVQYRLAMICPDSRKLLIDRRNGKHALPRICFPANTRVADRINRELHERWGFCATVVDYLRFEDGVVPCAIVELRLAGNTRIPASMEAMLLAMIADSCLLPHERDEISQILDGNYSAQKPFRRLGWIDKAQDWINSSVRCQGIELTGEFFQWNAGSSYALVCFPTRHGSACWLKAVHDPAWPEYRITRVLLDRLPAFLPAVLAMRDDWSAWVTADVGDSLRETFTLEHCKLALHQLAQLQIESIDHIDVLKHAGCPQIGVAAIQKHLDVLFDYLEDAMARQTSTRVLPLSAARLRELRQIVFDSCSEMRDLDIPDTLVHRDLNLGNILFEDSSCRFIDWAEAAIGNPILNSQYFQEHIVRHCESASRWGSELMESYRLPWRGILTFRQLDTAFVLAPILTVAAYLCGDGVWLCAAELPKAQVQAYHRSLARHIDRAAQTLHSTRASW